MFGLGWGEPKCWLTGNAGTHILACCSLSRWYLSICFASTMPAGHNWPPHPDARSSWTLTGSSRSPPKSNAVSPAALYFGSAVSPSLVEANGEKSGDGDRSFSLSSIILAAGLVFMFFFWSLRERVENGETRNEKRGSARVGLGCRSLDFCGYKAPPRPAKLIAIAGSAPQVSTALSNR